MLLTAGIRDLFHQHNTELCSKSVGKQNMDAKKQETPKTHPLYSLIQFPIAGHFHRASSSLLAMLWSQQSRGHWAVHWALQDTGILHFSNTCCTLTFTIGFGLGNVPNYLWGAKQVKARFINSLRTRAAQPTFQVSFHRHFFKMHALVY